MKYEVTAKRLEKALNIREMNAQTLADRSGVAKASISQYRHGRNIPNAHSARAMAAVLGVNPEWLMGFGDDNIEKYIVDAKLSDYEERIIDAYRQASPDTQAAVCAVLGIKGDAEHETAKSII